MQICVCKGEKWRARVKMGYKMYDSALFVRACVRVFTCPRSPGREKAENEIKGKQLYWQSP